MKLKILAIIILLVLGLKLSAQLTLYDQIIYRQYFNLTEYDSIDLSLDTAGAFNSILSVSQDYFFQNNSKIKSLKLVDHGNLFWEGFGELKDNSSVLKTYELPGQDTIQKETIYIDSQGRDSVYEIISNYKQPNEDITQVHYRYNSFGRVSSRIKFGGTPLDTTSEEKYFYSSVGLLDSILISESSGQVVLWVYFNKTGAGTVNSVFMIGRLPNNNIDTLSSYEPLYNSNAKVYEIRVFNYAFVPSKELTYVLRFYKKPNSTIGLHDAEVATQIDFYPNPTKKKALLVLPFVPSRETVVKIFSQTGQLLDTQTFIGPDNQLNLNINLPSGCYLLKIKSGSYEGSKPMIVK